MPVAEAKEPEVVRLEVVVNWTQARIEQEIKVVANKYGVSYDAMWRTIKCESGFDTDIQSYHTLSYGREQSYGLVQIHLPDHPYVTYDQAIDPAFAIDFMGKAFRDGNARWWTCWRKQQTP